MKKIRWIAAFFACIVLGAFWHTAAQAETFDSHAMLKTMHAQEAEKIQKDDLGYYYMNNQGERVNARGYVPMPLPTAEQLARQEKRLAMVALYDQKKMEGDYEEALKILKTMFPGTKTTLGDLKEIGRTGAAGNVPGAKYYDFGGAFEAGREKTGTAYRQANQQAGFLNMPFYFQETYYNCAPASVQMAIATQRVPPIQSSIAASLGTTVQGTAFAQPLANTLNANMQTLGPYEISWSAAMTTPNFTQAVRANIDAGFPVVANGVSYPANSGRFHLPFYPPNDAIWHYIAVYGYSDNGATVWVADPVAGTGIPGFEQVIPYYGYPMSVLHGFVWERGIVY